MCEMIALIGLCLLSTAIAKSSGYTAIKTVAEHEVSGHTTTIAPEMLDDQKFATLTFHSAVFQRQPEISVKVVGPNYDGRKCILPSPIHPVSLNLALNRVSRKYVVLSIFALNENLPSMPLKLLLINTEDCTLRYAYDGVLPRGKKYIFITSTNSSDERFTLITHGERYCGDHEWCRLHFDPIYRRHEALDVDVSWDELRNIEPATESFDANLFVAHYTDPETDFLTVRLYDFSSNRTGPPFKELLGMSSLNLWMPGRIIRTVSSGLSYVLQFSKLINETGDGLQCVRFGEDGRVMFNETIDKPGVALRAQTIPNGLVLFSMKDDCFLANWCKNVQVAVFTRNMVPGKSVQIQRREYKLKCHFVSSTLRVKMNEATNTIKYLEYLCQDDLHVSSRIIYEL